MRSAATIGVPELGPGMAVVQRTFVLSSNFSGTFVASLAPLKCGPRHWCHSFPGSAVRDGGGEGNKGEAEDGDDGTTGGAAAARHGWGPSLNREYPATGDGVVTVSASNLYHSGPALVST